MTIFKAFVDHRATVGGEKRRAGVWVALCLVVLGLLSAGTVSASTALADSSRWQLTSGSWPASLPVGGEGTIVVAAENLGDTEVDGSTTPVTIVDELPPGVTATAISGTAGFAVEGGSFAGPVECTLASLSCTFSGDLPPYELLQVYITVTSVQASAGGADNVVSLSGGGLPAASLNRPLRVSSEAPQFGVEDYELTPENEDGSLDTQAGSHPFQLTSTTLLSEGALNRETGELTPTALAKDLHFKLPAGFVGDPSAIPQCSTLDFSSRGPKFGEQTDCPLDTVIGVATVSVDIDGFHGTATETVPMFNLSPYVGEPARFGFVVFGDPVTLDTAVRTGGDYGVTVNVSNITQVALLYASRVTFWGVPGDPRHDSSRGWTCTVAFLRPCAASPSLPQVPFLTLPTSCSGALQTSLEADSWARPGSFTPPSVPGFEVALDGCNRLPFDPSISVAPDGRAGSTPTGLTVGVHVPQDATLNPTGLADSTVKNTTVVLPAGVAINPAAADGLEACSEAQIELSQDVVAACPEASKVGLVSIKTPLLPNELKGDVYLAAQDQNPFGSLIALYVVAADPVSGTLIKIAGEVKADPVTGRLVSTFENTPQLPFEDFSIEFFGGDRAPLATPALCGSYTTSASIAPWAGNDPASPSSTFDIASGPNGSPCESPLGFSPSLTAGTTNIQAGGFSPFTMTVSRGDGQQNIQSIQLHMPAGLSGLLAGVELCGEAQADAGTCGPNSLIGETTVSVGLGGDPYSVTGGKVYITGPYEGAPFGVSVVVPAKAGPYNLGQVVVRGTIAVNPITAALTVTTNSQAQGHAIPHILDGIPLEIKHVNFVTTRSGFTFNPTNCDPMGVTGSISSVEGSSSAVSVPFQVTNCAVLAFKPGFAVSTSGKTSRAEGASLNVKLTYPKAPFGSQANIKSVKVDLPKQLPSRLTTLQKACPAKTFESNPAGCPAASIVGHGTAITPLIPVPLTGPAYFVSYGGAKFPELVIVLQGYGVTLDLHGETFISKAGITSSTFHTVPDAPVGSFELNLPEGKFSALAANGNLCKSKLAMPTAFTAQNGAVIHESTKISATGCPKLKKKVKQSSKHHKGKSHGKKK